MRLCDTHLQGMVRELEGAGLGPWLQPGQETWNGGPEAMAVGMLALTSGLLSQVGVEVLVGTSCPLCDHALDDWPRAVADEVKAKFVEWGLLDWCPPS